MKLRWSVATLAIVGLLAAAMAFAADGAKKQSRGDDLRASAPSGDGSLAPGPAWEADEESGPLAFLDEDGDDWDMEGGPGPGMGAGGMGPGGLGHGMGMLGMHGGPGMGAGGGHGRGMGRGHGAGPGAAFARLDLSDAQREKLAAIHEQQMRKNVQARADLQIARMDLRKLLRAEVPSAAAINAQIDKLARMRADQQKAHIATFLEARALLTPEQQKQLRQAGPMGPGRGPGMQRPQPDGDAQAH